MEEEKMTTAVSSVLSKPLLFSQELPARTAGPEARTGEKGEVAQLFDLMERPDVLQGAQDFLKEAREALEKCKEQDPSQCGSVAQTARAFKGLVKDAGGDEMTANVMLLALGIAAGSYAHLMSPVLAVMLSPMVMDDPEGFRQGVQEEMHGLQQLPEDQKQILSTLGKKAQEVLPGLEEEEAIVAVGVGVGKLTPASPS